jgi:hypothetical protein
MVVPLAEKGSLIVNVKVSKVSLPVKTSESMLIVRFTGYPSIPKTDMLFSTVSFVFKA